MQDTVMAIGEIVGTLITVGGIVWHLSSELAAIKAQVSNVPEIKSQLSTVLTWIAKREEREANEAVYAPRARKKSR